MRILFLHFIASQGRRRKRGCETHQTKECILKKGQINDKSAQTSSKLKMNKEGTTVK